VFVFAVVFLCFYGLFCLPTFPTSLAQLRENFGSRIKLGLDLQGGTHLILQVQVNEAVSQQTDQALDHLTTQLRDKNIHYDELRKVGDTQILVHNLAPESTGTFRDLVDANFPDWSIAPAAGETSGYLLTAKPSTISAIQAQTMSQSEDTIRRRTDALGLTEPFVAPYGQGENEIIVELPGEGDPNRAKSVIQAGGQLQLHDSLSLEHGGLGRAWRRFASEH
jgi:preprotein translocase subunit SecD